MKIAFFETEPWEADYLKSNLPNHELSFSEERIDADHMPESKDADILSVFTNCEVTAPVIGAFPNLKFMTTRSTGFDHVDRAALAARNIPLSYVPSYGENTVAEFAFGLLLTVSRKIFLSYDRIREEGSFDLDGLQGFDLRGKTIGIVGTGRIGRHMAKIAKGFEMEVIAFGAYPNDSLASELGFRYVSFEELLNAADVISFHVPELPTTFHMINMENTNLIKRGAIIINTARGSVVETTALVKALNEGILGGAGLDVLEEEVPTKDEKEFLISGKTRGHDLLTVLQNHLLIDMPNVIITPHNAFNTKEALQRILDTTIENINKFIDGAPVNLVK
ncbi:MAG: NAD(P)-dependent oxidoreductase [Candidatus Colwellbacteria bacterium]|nr:NAD(P)-dependent oxidoreductase [Candidatus Colwellbacteria bacterium]